MKKKILVTLAALGVIVCMAGCGEKAEEKKEIAEKETIIWDNLLLGDVIPNPDSEYGEVLDNSEENCWIDVYEISDAEYRKYIDKCKGEGFDIDSEINDNSYIAYNSDGYKLDIYYYDSKEELNIHCDAPLEMKELHLPDTDIGNSLPIPKSNKGNMEWEHEDSFYATFGDTTLEEFENYIEECSKKGYNVNYDKGDTYYRAYNEKGYYVSIDYIGMNSMTIQADTKEDDVAETKEDTVETENENLDESSEISKEDNKSDDEPKQNINEIGSDFKKSMDSYEAFIDEYIEFMNEYAKAEGLDADMLSAYSDYMSKYSEFVSDFEKWENEDLNDAELVYYLEVQTRVTEKLLEVAY